MIDTIGIYIKRPLEQFINEYEGNLKIEKSNKSNVYWIKNIMITGNSIYTFIKVSLPRFLVGTNQKCLSVFGVGKAADKIAELFNRKIFEIDLYRIDVGFNYIMNKSFANYITELDSLKYFEKGFVEDTFYFRNKSNEVCIYDKKKEVISNGGIDEFENYPNVLRYELKFKKNIRQSLKMKSERITLDNLKNKEFLKLLLNLYLTTFLNIKKVPVDNVNIAPNEILNIKPSIIKSYLASVGLETIGTTVLFRHINSVGYNSQQRFQLKRSLEKLNNYLKIEITNSDFEELERKVKSRVKKYNRKIAAYQN